MKLRVFVLPAVLLFAGSFPAISYAHSGGLNADGCHAGSQPYHCHRPQRAAAPARQGILGTGGDRNCADFATWRQAQDFYEDAGPGDPHRLDADHDGIACEGLQ